MEAIFATFGPLWSWPWPWIGLYGIPSCITHQPLPTQQILYKFDGRTNGWTDIESINVMRSLMCKVTHMGRRDLLVLADLLTLTNRVMLHYDKTHRLVVWNAVVNCQFPDLEFEFLPSGRLRNTDRCQILTQNMTLKRAASSPVNPVR